MHHILIVLGYVVAGIFIIGTIAFYGSGDSDSSSSPSLYPGRPRKLSRFEKFIRWDKMSDGQQKAFGTIMAILIFIALLVGATLISFATHQPGHDSYPDDAPNFMDSPPRGSM